jgi:myotubularin-related protein 14
MTDGLVERETIDSLLARFAKNTHKTKFGDAQNEAALKRCLHLFAQDYAVETISNTSGELCSHYPGKLIIPERNHSERSSNNEVLSSVNASSRRRFSSCGVEKPAAAASHLSDIMQKARFARCRSRFVVPVILYGNKYICRSSTLSSGAEMYGRSGLGWLFSRGAVLCQNYHVCPCCHH